MKPFDHLSKSIAEALHIDNATSAEMHSIIEDITSDDNTEYQQTSRKVEKILNEGYTFVELAYACYMLGCVDTINKGRRTATNILSDTLGSKDSFMPGSILGGPFAAGKKKTKSPAKKPKKSGTDEDQK